MEYWDLYDKNRKPLNKIHQRGVPLNKGEYHLVVSIVTINSKKQILTTLRDPYKEQYPNLWEVTAGSAVSGETSISAALRELFEETGIKAYDYELIKTGTCIGNTAFTDVYILKKDIEIKNLKMQPGETVDAKWVSYEQFIDMIEKGQIANSWIRNPNVFKEFIFDNIV